MEIQKSGKTMTIQTVKQVPTPVLVVGGVVGTAAIVAVGYAALTLFSVAVTGLTYAVFGVIILAFWVMWPTFLRALRIARIRIDDQVTKANPIEALEDNLSTFREQINERKELIAKAAGAVEMMKRTFEKQQSRMTPEKRQEWLGIINTRSQMIKQAEEKIDVLIKEYRDYQLVIESARAELLMAEADSTFASAMSETSNGKYGVSKTTETALNEVSRRVGESRKNLELSTRSIESLTEIRAV